MKQNSTDRMIESGGLRESSLDIYKGLAIFLVVAGHLAQGAGGDPDRNLLFKTIYMFHMPLFFFISGMVYAIKPMEMSVGYLGGSILKRGKQLLLPFFTWYCISYFLSGSTATIPDYILGLLNSPDSGLWFLWVLFSIASVADVCKVLAGKKTVLFIFFAAGIWAAFFHLRIHFYKLGVGLIAFHMPFFFAGIFHRQIVQATRHWRSQLAIFCSVIFPFLVYYWERLNPPQIGLMLQEALKLPMSTILYSVYLAMGYFYQSVFAVVGIVVFFIGSKVFTQKDNEIDPVSRCLVFIGRRTLGIYAMHLYFINILPFSSSQFTNGIYSAVMSIGLSVLIEEYLLKPNPVAAYLLLGKNARVVKC